MRYLTVTLFLIGAVVLSGTARADYEDQLWTAQCVRDYASSEVATTVLLKYCMCMTDKMDDEETKPVIEWEQAHSAEKASCMAKVRWDTPQSAPDAPPIKGGHKRRTP